MRSAKSDNTETMKITQNKSKFGEFKSFDNFDFFAFTNQTETI